MRKQIQFTAFTVLSATLLASCASAPKPIELPVSSFTAKTESVDGSAIAFQASDGTCNKSGFKISQKLEDGKYGPAQPIEINSSTFKFKSKSLKQTKFASSKKQLYVKTMAPGEYVFTRIWCYDVNGQKATTLYTKHDRVDIFGEFTVEPGKTNYIGALTVGRSHGRLNYPTFTIRDQSVDASVFFDEHYADKVAPMQVKLAQRKGPGQSLGGGTLSDPERRAALMKALENIRAHAAERKAAEEAAKTEE